MSGLAGDITWGDVDRWENGAVDDDDHPTFGENGEEGEPVTVILAITVTEEHDMVRLPGESDDDLYFRARREHSPDRDSQDHWEGVEIRVR